MHARWIYPLNYHLFTYLHTYDDDNDDEVNHDSEDKTLAAERDHVAREAANQPRMLTEEPTYEDFADEWWPAKPRDIGIYKKDVDDNHLSNADFSFDLQRAVRRRPGNLRFRLGKRSSTNPKIGSFKTRGRAKRAESI